MTFNVGQITIWGKSQRMSVCRQTRNTAATARAFVARACACEWTNWHILWQSVSMVTVVCWVRLFDRSAKISTRPWGRRTFLFCLTDTTVPWPYRDSQGSQQTLCQCMHSFKNEKTHESQQQQVSLGSSTLCLIALKMSKVAASDCRSEQSRIAFWTPDLCHRCGSHAALHLNSTFRIDPRVFGRKKSYWSTLCIKDFDVVAWNVEVKMSCFVNMNDYCDTALCKKTPSNSKQRTCVFSSRTHDADDSSRSWDTWHSTSSWFARLVNLTEAESHPPVPEELDSARSRIIKRVVIPFISAALQLVVLIPPRRRRRRPRRCTIAPPPPPPSTEPPQLQLHRRATQRKLTFNAAQRHNYTLLGQTFLVLSIQYTNTQARLLVEQLWCIRSGSKDFAINEGPK